MDNLYLKIMSTETNSVDPNALDSERQADIDADFERGTGLPGDAVNLYAHLSFYEDSASLDEIEPLPHYRDWYKGRISQGYAAAEIEYILTKSDPAAVSALDNVIDEFNAALPQIKGSKDIDALKTFIERFERLVKGE